MKIKCSHAFCSWELSPQAVEVRRDGPQWYFHCPVCSHQTPLKRDIAVELQLGHMHDLAHALQEYA